MKIISTPIYYYKTINLLSKYFNNWLEIFIKLLSKKPINLLSLKNGFSFISSNSNNLYEIVKEVWIENRYLPKNILLDKNGVIIDIGANVGVFSIYASTLTSGKILAVEPFDENCKYLKQNLKNNIVTNVIIEKIAVSKSSGKRYFYTLDSDSGHNFYFKNKSKNKKLINTTTFKQLIQNHSIKKIELLKVDCEGAEGEIFESLSPIILKNINNIALEFHDNCSSLSHQQIKKILTKAGFRVQVDWDGKSPFGYIYAKRLA